MVSADIYQGVVDEEEQDATLAAVVRGLMDGLSWNKSRALIRSGRVKVDGELRFEPAERPGAGVLVEVNPTGRRRTAPPLPRERIVHVDRDFVVVRKPAGLLSVPWSDDDQRDTLIERTRLALREYGFGPAGKGRGKGSGSRSDRLGVVQRLDKDTTGLLVFTRTRRARKALESQFRAHTVHRRYLALVHGRAEAEIYESHLVADRGDGLRGSWRGGSPPKAARHAITKVRVEARLAGATLISCQLETGRQHQIRIHLAEAGHPLIGEPVYGRGYQGPRIDAPRPMLHAASLGFHHPGGGDRTLRFEAPVPDDLSEAIAGLRIQATSDDPQDPLV